VAAPALAEPGFSLTAGKKRVSAPEKRPPARKEAVLNMTLDVPSLRSDTPRMANILHFNNAGAALPPQPALAW